MIKSFRSKDEEDLFNRTRFQKFQSFERPARRKLEQINAANDIQDLLHPPGNRLETLSGNRKGQWSIRINRQYRVCFEWRDGHAENVEITDYH